MREARPDLYAEPHGMAMCPECFSTSCDGHKTKPGWQTGKFLANTVGYDGVLPEGRYEVLCQHGHLHAVTLVEGYKVRDIASGRWLYELGCEVVAFRMAEPEYMI